MHTGPHKKDNNPKKEDQPKLPISHSQAESIHTSIVSKINQIEQLKYSKPYHISLSDTLNPIKGYAPLIDRQRVSTYGKLNYSTNARSILKSSPAYNPLPRVPNKKIRFYNQIEIFADTSQPIYTASLINGKLVIKNNLPPNVSTHNQPINTREQKVVFKEKTPTGKKSNFQITNEFLKAYLEKFSQAGIIPPGIYLSFDEDRKSHYADLICCMQELLQNQMPKSLRNDINIVLNSVLNRNRNRELILRNTSNIPDILKLRISQYKKLVDVDLTQFQNIDNDPSVKPYPQFKGTIPANEYRLENVYLALKILNETLFNIKNYQSVFTELIEKLVSSSDNIKPKDLQAIPEDDLEACDTIETLFNRYNDIVKKEGKSSQDVYTAKILIISANNILESLKQKYTQFLESLENYKNALCSYYSTACDETITNISDRCDIIVANSRCSFKNFNAFSKEVISLLGAVCSSSTREIPSKLITFYKKKISDIYKLLEKLAKKEYTDFYQKESIPESPLFWKDYDSDDAKKLNENIEIIAKNISYIDKLIVKYPLIFKDSLPILSKPPEEETLRNIYYNYYDISRALKRLSDAYINLLHVRYSRYYIEKNKYKEFSKYHIDNKDPEHNILKQALKIVDNICNIYLPILNSNPDEKEYWENQKQKLKEQITCKCCI